MSRRRDKKRAAEPPNPSVPVRCVAADMSKQVPNNYCGPVTVYFDIPFRCRDCRKKEVWTAEQQKWYYEEAKGSLLAKAVRCHECRKRLKEQKQKQLEQMAKADSQNQTEI